DPSKVDWSKQRNGAVATSRDTEQITPKGAVVYSKNGVSNSVLSKIDTGLDKAFEDARTSGYTQKLDHRSYDIFIPRFECIPSPESKTPSFLIRADVYD